jgi:hypothetical protein
MEGRLYLGKLPLGGSEISLRREIGVERATSIPLTTLIHHTVSPPFDRKSTFGNLESKEYDNGCNGDTARESGGKDIIILGPKLCIPWSSRQLLLCHYRETGILDVLERKKGDIEPW